ncbi:MAG: radical SAM protein [Spirochaetales bacterium]|nr:radical SAM protein [Spirochaetales bacterium]
MKFRYENFGGIIASNAPPFLAFVNREYARNQGYEESPLWQGNDDIDILTAPTEVHLAITSTCTGDCPHCYMDSGARDPDELDTIGLKKALTALANMGVFHVALGGGEALLRDDLFEVAAHARKIGLVPNLTVSGLNLSEKNVHKMKVFGQVNVSVDGVGDAHAVFRGPHKFLQADSALDLLIKAGVPTGINCVVGRSNYGGLKDLFAYAQKKGVNELEFLRVKPSGRGLDLYYKERLDFKQSIKLLPLLSNYSRKFKVPAKIDCSFVPMLLWHRPSKKLLLANATYGCEAGNVLIGAKSSGRVSGCSFLPALDLTIDQLADQWEEYPAFQELRHWPEQAAEPCRSCGYLKICKGGCHAVAEKITGSLWDPDPDCPRVILYRQFNRA